MYIFELLYKIYKGKNYYKRAPKDFSPQDIGLDEQDALCNHFFMPIDSSGETLACKYCGLIIKNDKRD